jgi:hypothetical protein
MQTLRRPRPMRPPVSIHMMPDFSAYDSHNTQSVSLSSGTAQPAGGPGLYSHKSLKRKRSESTEDSDDAEDRGYYHLHPSFGHTHPVAESGYTPTKSDERGHAAKRARLADDFAELRLRGQSLSPASSINLGSVPLWAPPPVVEESVSASPPTQALAPVELDLAHEYVHVHPQRGVEVAPYPPAPFPLDVHVNPAGVLRGEVEEVVSPGVQAERSKSGSTTPDRNGHDIKMHGTSSYEPEKDRASPFFLPSRPERVLKVSIISQG